jgi:hypothetical protein
MALNQEHRMRRLLCAAATFVLISAACRKQQSNETGGMNDTTLADNTAATTAPAAADTVSSPGDFSFDQRQAFTQSIRQQLGDLDRQIQELSAQAKSRGGAVSDRALTTIRVSRRAVDQSLSRVEGATAANWDQIKQRVNQAVDNVSESIQAAQPK